MQANDATAADVTPQQLAAELLDFWGCLMRGRTEVYALFEELDLSFTQIKTMAFLDHNDGDPSVKDLSESLGLSLAGTSRTVDALLRRGWVDRREDEQDRRVKRLRLTADGATVLSRIEAARLAGITDFTAALTPAQRARLSAVIADLPPFPVA
jgi:DNA-binding MarR family transcriptional regulator